MYIFKNAFTSIKRNVGRNLLIGIIVVVIACATTITLAIRSSATSLIDSYEKEYDVVASIGINRESMRGEMRPNENMSSEDFESKREEMTDIFSNVSSISIDDINNYGNSEYVKDYYYQVSIGVNSELEKVSMSNNDSNRPSMPGRENFSNKSSSDFTLVGYSTTSAMEDFISGKYSITSGTIEEGDTCVINSELATMNNISVGDEITLINPDNEEETLTLKVSGIYEEKSDTSDMMGMFTSSANTIITNSDVVNDFTSENEDIKKTITPSFILTDKSVVDNFSKELTSKGMSEYLSVSTNIEQVESATSTISNVKTFATTFLIITLIIGGIVLFVINMINIRERKYEIGVLRTIGMKKSKLALQFMIELLIVSSISLAIGAAIGASSSVGVSNYLLKQEITNASAVKENIQGNFGGKDMGKINGMVNVQAFDSIDAAVNIKILGELLGIGLILTLISSMASMISIQKFSPLTILKERS